MSWAVTDGTPTATVVWMAAEQIGKAPSHEQLQKICDYLVNRHWFQTAADLRSARQETTEWQALEMPGRLKLAIQQVLDQRTHYESVPDYGYEDYYAAVRPSLTPGSESTTQEWADATSGYGYNEGADQGARDYYSGGYTYDATEATTDTTTSAQYGYDQSAYGQTEYSNPPPYDESYGANYASYYNNTSAEATSSYNDNDAVAATLLSLRSSSEHIGYSVQQSQVDTSDAVEAHAVEADSTEDYVESELVPDQTSYNVEPCEPSQHDINETTGTWSCGRCTYMNPMTSSFCEMCIGHISLSPDVKTAPGTSASASLLIPAKPIVDVVMDSPRAEHLDSSYSLQTSQPSVTCMLPPVGPMYPPSAPDYDSSEEPVVSTPLPPPPPYPGTSSCGNVDFLALAFSGSSAPKTQAPRGSSPTSKSSQMRRGEIATITEYTF